MGNSGDYCATDPTKDIVWDNLECSIKSWMGRCIQ